MIHCPQFWSGILCQDHHFPVLSFKKTHSGQAYFSKHKALDTASSRNWLTVLGLLMNGKKNTPGTLKSSSFLA